MSLIDAKEVKNEKGLIKVRRDNVILRVEPEQKSYYMGLGYNVVDNSGNVIEETVPTDVASLQRFYKDAKQQIAELQAEIKSLKAQKQPKAKELEANFEASVSTPTPTKRRKRQ